MTPRELLAFIEGAQRRMIAAAWYAEAMARQKKLKPLTSYLRPRQPLRSPDEARAELEDLKARLGRGLGQEGGGRRDEGAG